MGFKIEKGVGLTESRKGKIKYPFAEMESGDSFLVDLGSEGFDPVYRRIYSAAFSYHRRVDRAFTFAVRKVGNGARFHCITSSLNQPQQAAGATP